TSVRDTQTLFRRPHKPLDMQMLAEIRPAGIEWRVMAAEQFVNSAQHRVIVVLIIVAGCRPSASPIATRTPPGHSKPAATTAIRFPIAATQLGLDFTYRNGEDAERYAILESMGGGVGLLDFDLDG